MMTDMEIYWRAKYNERYQACVIRRDSAAVYVMHIADQGQPIHAQTISPDEALDTEWVEQLAMDIISEHELPMMHSETLPVTLSGIDDTAVA